MDEPVGKSDKFWAELDKLVHSKLPSCYSIYPVTFGPSLNLKQRKHVLLYSTHFLHILVPDVNVPTRALPQNVVLHICAQI